jgi:hypothetical protein
MATNNCTTCGCTKPKCGCQDTMLTTPAPCPTPVGCPTPEPCSEVFDSQCIVYTGTEILCGDDTIVLTGSTIAEALNAIVDYFCNSSGACDTCITQTLTCPSLITISPGDTVQEALDEIVKAICALNVDIQNLQQQSAIFSEEIGTIQAKFFTYEIGQSVPSQGGVIAHRWWSTTAGGVPENGLVQNYLVIDTTELSVSGQWATSNVLTNIDSTYNGVANTNNIVGLGGAGGFTVGTAGLLCAASTNNGKTDWYLPAVDEFSKVYHNKWEIAQGLDDAGGQPLSATQHWSSTEYNIGQAYYYFLLGGYADTDTKVSNYTVRAVRRFSI